MRFCNFMFIYMICFIVSYFRKQNKKVHIAAETLHRVIERTPAVRVVERHCGSCCRWKLLEETAKMMVSELASMLHTQTCNPRPSFTSSASICTRTTLTLHDSMLAAPGGDYLAEIVFKWFYWTVLASQDYTASMGVYEASGDASWYIYPLSMKNKPSGAG